MTIRPIRARSLRWPEAPDQYDPSKTHAEEGSAFDEIMDEFKDFEGDDSYDDEY